MKILLVIFFLGRFIFFFIALTRLDYNRTLNFLSETLGVHTSEFENVAVLGNHG